ncbi:MAG TPA: c-type cytochrome [Acidobacteriaceae bacterium]|nr:c-type cytochrome [Acidobacteriaceae bacterium]
MKARFLVFSALMVSSLLCFATANGSWLKKVPEADRARVNPYAGNVEAARAGANLFHNNCAKCHGENAEGKGSRPSLKSERIKNATDGEIAWLLKNGEVYKGMPTWAGLPEQERWQIITYLRSRNP